MFVASFYGLIKMLEMIPKSAAKDEEHTKSSTTGKE